MRVCDQNGNPLGEATAAPSVTATPVVYSGYVKLTKTGVNLRVSPGGRSQGQYDIGLIHSPAGATVSSGRYQWFCVRTPDGKTGYVRSDCAVPCDLNGNQVTVTPTPGADHDHEHQHLRLYSDYQAQHESAPHHRRVKPSTSWRKSLSGR